MLFHFHAEYYKKHSWNYQNRKNYVNTKPESCSKLAKHKTNAANQKRIGNTKFMYFLIPRCYYSAAFWCGSFPKNIYKRQLCRHDKNYYYFFCKSNIRVINFIVCSRSIIKVSKNMSFYKIRLTARIAFTKYQHFLWRQKCFFMYFYKKTRILMLLNKSST